ncbi:MAG: glutathione S-transferase [Kordiimonas sp.]|nr:glutathione S-transferase [Kordiimonas sp.]|tara:strand:- start:841 stop:1530 length:690 start_codon:yes stop_codon:yes gene_type:complete
MSISPKLELISFKTCPFVQRSVVTLLEKGVDFDITYIDLANKPDWFLEISPLGKVPVLKVDGEILFESAVINEFLDEIIPPALHPSDPLLKAKNRAWIEFGNQISGDLFQLMHAKDKETYFEKKNAAREKLERLEGQLGDGPLFNGEAFSLADAAYAGTLRRMDVFKRHLGLDLIAGLPKMEKWSAAMLSRPAVKDSTVEDFDELYLARLEKMGGYIAGALDKKSTLDI